MSVNLAIYTFSNHNCLIYLFRAMTTAQADWTREFHNTEMYNNVDLKRWFLIYPTNTKAPSMNFLDLLMQASRGMRFKMEPPKQ